MNKALVLKARPDETFPENMDFFEVRHLPLPELNQDEILIRVLFIGVDPVMRVWLSGAKTYIDAVHIDQVMPAFGVGVCEETRSKKFRKGELAFGVLECADFCKRVVKGLFKVPGNFQVGDPVIPLTLSVFGVTGLTALNGMKQIPNSCRPSKTCPKTFAVSSAAGSTGSFAIQIAKHYGYRTVGIVSSDDKKKFLESLGVDTCVTYNDAKDGDEINVVKLTKLISLVAPEGIDAYFDNSGEEVLDAVIPVMNKDSYMILCGATSTYNTWKKRGGITNIPLMISKRIQVEGIMYYNEKQRMYEAFPEMIELVTEGIIKHQEEFYSGVQSFVAGLQRVFTGQNLGKIIIQIDQSVPLPKY